MGRTTFLLLAVAYYIVTVIVVIVILNLINRKEKKWIKETNRWIRKGKEFGYFSKYAFGIK